MTLNDIAFFYISTAVVFLSQHNIYRKYGPMYVILKDVIGLLTIHTALYHMNYGRIPHYFFLSHPNFTVDKPLMLQVKLYID